jgi:hypothetical protein
VKVLGIAQLAVRIFDTIGKRVFSAVNLIMTKLQTHLGIDTAESLIYIFANYDFVQEW